MKNNNLARNINPKIKYYYNILLSLEAREILYKYITSIMNY